MMLTATKLVRYARLLPVKTSRAIVAGYVRTTARHDLIRLGSDYGGWWVPADLLSADSVCYLAGVGEDITFDLALIERFSCHVWAIDPTPRSIAHVAGVADPRFHFLPVGVWDEDTTMRFYEPANPAHVSHSIVNTQRTSGGFDAECKTVRTLMSELRHDRIDLLKLDIEGAEAAVLAALLRDGILPRVLCVEFDAIEAPWTSIQRLKLLTSAGFQTCYREGRNYTFVHTLPAAWPLS